MNDRVSLRIIGTLLAGLAIFPIAKGNDKPNIVVILADDLGYSDLGCYGGEINTPHIDALAGDGVRFTQMYNSARCCPSRASLMTGLYPSQAGIGDFTTNKPSPTRGPGYLGRLNDRCATIAEVLKPAGYGCYYVGKWHMNHQTGPIQRGFDEFYGYTRGHSHNQYDADYYIRLPSGRAKEIAPPAGEFYATDVFNDYALEFIKQGQESGKPWFLFLGHSSPHFPVQAPAERADRYDDTYHRGWDVLRDERFARMQEIGLIDGPHWKLSPRSVVPVDRGDIANGFSGKPNPAWDSLDSDRQHDLARRMAVFAAMVESVDDGVGRIVDQLKATNEFDNTLILFLSDNGACYEWGPFGFDGTSRKGETMLRTGEQLREIGGPKTHQSYGSGWSNLGNTPFRLYKHFTHEGGISTPMIAHWPAGIGKPNKWVRDPAHVMDLMPTFIEVAGATYPTKRGENEITPLEGTSLLPAMHGKSLPSRTIGFDHQAAHAIRQGDWKAVYSKRMPHKLKWELYNLAEDRCEMNDLAKEEPARLKQMVADWNTWARRVGVIWDAGNAKGRGLGQSKPKSGIKKPLFADPNYNGSCDPEVVWNPHTKQWFIYYTARRATRDQGTYVGTPIGVISSPDLKDWQFQGYCSFDGRQGRPDNDDTHWAPGIVVAGDKMHMFATYKASSKPPWGGPGVIRHYVAPLDNPIVGWELVERPNFNQPDPIDVSLLQIGNSYQAYYRVGKGGGIQWAASNDLTNWQNKGKCLGAVNAKSRGYGYQEAPYVFKFLNRYWMLTDPHQGLAVFCSDDGITWKQQTRILEQPGTGEADATVARHPSVAVAGDRAFIFYHTEPNRPYPSPPAEQRKPRQKISFLQMAELEVIDGVLTCDRDAIIDFGEKLRPIRSQRP